MIPQAKHSVGFIGREQELAEIERALPEWDTTRCFAIRAEGGIGKTRLLEEVQRLTSQKRLFSLTHRSTIALVQELTDSEWSHEFIRGARTMATALGVNLIETDARFSLTQMAEDLADVVAQRPDAIIVSLGTDEQLRPALEKAVQHGIPLLTFDNYLENTGDLVSRVSQDDLDGARVLLERMAEDLEYQGKIAAVCVPEHFPQHQRYQVLNTILTKYPEIELVETYGEMHPDIQQTTYQATKALLKRSPNLKAIWAAFNEFAEGVVRALIEENRTDIRVYSFDFCTRDFELMQQSNSPWTATVAIDPYVGGEVIVRLATLAAQRDVLDGELKRRYSLPMALMTRSEVERLESFPSNWYHSELGWTPRLRAILASRTSEAGDILKVLDIIDFDDKSLDVAHNLEFRLARQLGDTVADDLLSELQVLRALEEDFLAEGQEQQQHELVQKLANAFNEVSRKQRLVVLFDTLEKADRHTCVQLATLAQLAQNTIMLFAGRPSTEQQAFNCWEVLETALKDDLQVLEVKRFDEVKSALYLAKKQQELHIALPANLAQIIIALAAGKPILMDLATEYWARAIRLDEIAALNIADFTQQPPDQQQDARRRFERLLVSRVLEIRRPLDRLILAMSRIYPLNPTMIAALLRIPPAQADHLYAEAATYTFVKHLPDGLSLHDEMRRLVEEYVWHEIDPGYERRKRDSAIAAALYKQQDAAIQQKRWHLEEQLVSAEVKRPTDLVILEELENDRESLTLKWFEHALYSNLENNLREWKSVVDTIRHARKYQFLLRLAQLAAPYAQAGGPEDQYLINFTYARAVMDVGDLNRARDLFLKLLAKHEHDPERSSFIQNLLGVIETRAANYEAALKYQKAALQSISYANGSAVANLENQIGYICRLLDQLDDAAIHYRLALDSALALDRDLSEPGRHKPNQALIASLYNNLGYVFGLKRNYLESDDYLLSALEVYSSLGKMRDISRVQTTQAILARDRGLLRQSVGLLEDALRRCQDPDDYQEICRAHFHLGWSLWFSAEDDPTQELPELDLLSRALASLERSRLYAERYSLRQELPGIYHLLASVYWRVGRVENNADKRAFARSLNDKALTLSQQTNNFKYAVSSIVNYAEFDFDEGREEHLAAYQEDLLLYEYRDGQHTYSLFYGRFRRIAGDFAFARSDYERAFDWYAQAYPMINKHGGYGPFSIRRELSRLAFKIDGLAPTDAKRWLTYLRKMFEMGALSGIVDLKLWCDNRLIVTELRGRI
jgi:ABC-type sugar transport system substrate-binding protein